MFVLGGALLGLIIGAMIAKKRKGGRLDILQYAIVYAIAFALLGLFVTIGVHRFSV
ncbi:hypothetical protein SAMN05444000_11545 [Shimia gijangensis]|uniref:PEP-CTERM protein-sorting domain-containing protein n=1 Tax=Shimia gijangensis TaxID=1470563 RepID=A0A1M6N4W5_9RHOB|nr:hypothetical protein [Shimia gijangensis]SHJ90769.1 hypothetical protein SAMN05444000_11545 [Shimia gijangensis]